MKQNKLAVWRLRMLVGLLLFVLVGGSAHSLRVRHHEKLLVELGKTLVNQTNERDERPIPEEGPEADVAIEVHFAQEYLVFGEKSGKIRLLVTPREHAKVKDPFVIAYLCTFEKGKWKEVESHHEH